MSKLRGTYVHRGDAIRRRARIRSALALIGIVGAALLVIANRRPSPATAEAASLSGGSSGFSFGLVGENRRLRQELENITGEAALLKAQVERANKVIEYSGRYGITASLAEIIFDAALAERLDPELAFRMVKLESNFNPRAVSKVGALGLVQVMPSTARLFDKNVTREDLFNPQINARIGFRYMRRLIGLYKGDVRLALLAYNLGESRVDEARRSGRNPLEGYNRILLKSYTGTGVSD
jgi:soluble lytic murein transglycosylase-like protein